MEEAIRRGRLEPGERLPAVRALARELDVSPATVAGAYKELRRRGFVAGERGGGTSVAMSPPARIRPAVPLPPGARDLRSGNPDPRLLPPLAPVLATLDPTHALYGADAKLPALVAAAEREFAADGIDGELAIVAGALDGIERALGTELRPGDSVAVEDPSWPRIADLLQAMGLAVVPVPVDDRGLVPDELEAALDAGARAVIATPRGQNPTGAFVDAARGRALRSVLADHPDVLVVEDDYVAAVAGAPYVAVHTPKGRWVSIRSLSKVFGPDLRIALVAGDPATISKLEGRQRLGVGWVSHLLQQTAARLLQDGPTQRLVARGAAAYADRRKALVAALAAQGVPATGATGLGVWVPVEEETATVEALLAAGWAVSPGERYRFHTPTGIRITTADLRPDEAKRLAEAIARLRLVPDRTYAA